MNKTTSKVLDKMIDDATADLAALRSENARLRESLQRIANDPRVAEIDEPGDGNYLHIAWDFRNIAHTAVTSKKSDHICQCGHLQDDHALIGGTRTNCWEADCECRRYRAALVPAVKGAVTMAKHPDYVLRKNAQRGAITTKCPGCHRKSALSRMMTNFSNPLVPGWKAYRICRSIVDTKR